MIKLNFLASTAAVILCLPSVARPAVAAEQTPIPVKLVKSGNGFKLVRGGSPYFIKGAGGDASKTLLKHVGGNSLRTWGTDGLDTLLPRAQALGLTVTAGIWLGHTDNGFSYHNPAQVKAQFDSAQTAVLKYKDSPALLIWAVGNEMENGDENDPAVYTAIEDIAAMIKKNDPHHPTMTVFAEIDPVKVSNLNKYCPDVDILGINSYGGAASVGARYAKASA